jgi:hypothetical protein
MIKKHSDLIVLSIIWIVSILSVVTAFKNSYRLGISNYIGYTMLIGISVLRIYKVKRFKTVIGILLLLGSFNVIQFTYFTMTMIFAWTPLGDKYSTFGIQPLSIILLIFFIIINFRDFMVVWHELFSEDPQIAIEKQKRKVEKHYEELKNENDTKLQEIIDNKKMYQIEYVRAAQRLKEERKTKQ